MRQNRRAITSGTSRYYDLFVAPDDKIVYASDASGIADIFEISAGWWRCEAVDFGRTAKLCAGRFAG